MKNICIENRTPIETYGHSSKGNQPKWEIDGFWYKADGLGYEGLSEVVASSFLELSSVNNFVRYELVRIQWDKKNFDGCRSANFRETGCQLVTAERLYRSYTGLSLAGEMAKYAEVRDRIQMMVSFIEKTTGLQNFGKYLSMMLEMDAFFQNEDRHTNNIALLYYPQRDTFDYCPYFDFGAGLYSDITNDYPLNKSIEECAKKICAKPFSRDFDEQTDEACSLYKGGFRFNAGKQELMKRWAKIRKEYEKESIRPVAKEITARTEEFLYSQIRKYQYLFLK